MITSIYSSFQFQRDFGCQDHLPDVIRQGIQQSRVIDVDSRQSFIDQLPQTIVFYKTMIGIGGNNEPFGNREFQCIRDDSYS